MNSPTTQFGAELYRLRHVRSLTQTQVANNAGLNRGYYSQLENSRAPPPPAKTLLKIALALDLANGEKQLLFGLAEAERVRPGYREGELPQQTQTLVILRGRERLDVSEDKAQRITAILNEEI